MPAIRMRYTVNTEGMDLMNKWYSFLRGDRENMRRLSYPMEQYPEVYNAEGRKMEFFYLQDQIMGTYSESKYFLWDRCNYGLDTHFYAHNNMLFTKGKPIRKYGILIESKQIVPDNYRIFERYKGLEREFDAIFTYDADLLNRYENARFFPSCASIWYGQTEKGYEWDDECYMKKDRQISIVSSNKTMCHMHKVRLDLAMKCKKDGLADTYGTFDGGACIKIDDSLTRYRYSIVVENDVSDYFYTEKILNCFASQTIPIYIGAEKIDEFFNVDGIIRLQEKDIDQVEKIIKNCTQKYYEQHLEAILDNYKRAFQYRNLYDVLYERYLVRK